MEATVTVNLEQGLYVIPEASGYSCLGFDVCLEWANGIAAWLRENGIDAKNIPAEQRGTLAAYDLYRALCIAGRQLNAATGKRCPALLTPQLVGLEGRRVEVVDHWGQKRRFYVGKSTGWLPVHLEIARINSSGGPGVVGAPFRSVRVIPGRVR